MADGEVSQADQDKERIRVTNKFLQAAAFFIAATAKAKNLEVLIIVTDKHERPAVCMASSLTQDKQPQLLLDVLLQMSGGVEEIAKLATEMEKQLRENEKHQ